MQNGRKATISDIAAASGLSKTTVSRYINGMTHLMSEETCIKLKGIIERMNYRPSSIARSLKSKKTHTVGVVVADISSPWSSAVVGGIGDVLLKEEYIPIFANANEDINREKDYITSLLEREVDGLIVNTASDINPFLIEIAKTGVPIVLCDRYVQDYDFDIVTIDNEGMMFKILEHLKEQGFTRIALFTLPYSHNSARYQRAESFVNGMNLLFSKDSTSDIYIFNGSRELDEQLSAFLASLTPGDIPVIFGVNTVTTIYVYQGIKRAGLRIPDDMGVCGPDDWNWASGMNWPNVTDTGVTTMKIHSRRIGEQAARMLLDRIRHPELERQEEKLLTDLVVRESTIRVK